MALRLNPLDIVRCRIPQTAPHGDPTQPGEDYHRVLVIRTTMEADGSQWAHVVFGTGQGTSDKEGGPVGADQLEVDVDDATKLTTQTRFHFNKHVALKVDAPWFPTDPGVLARGRLPKSQHAQANALIAKLAPVSKLTSPAYSTAKPTKVEVKRKFVLPRLDASNTNDGDQS